MHTNSHAKLKFIVDARIRKVNKLKTSSNKAGNKSPAILRSPAKPPIVGIKPFLCLKRKPPKRSILSPTKSIKDKIRVFESKLKCRKPSQEDKCVKDRNVNKTDKNVKIKSDKMKRIVEMFEKDDASEQVNRDSVNTSTRNEGQKVKNAFELMMMTKGDTPTRKTPKLKRIRSRSTKK